MRPRRVVVIDETAGVTIASEGRVASGFLARLRGLMLAPPLRPGEALVIVPCSSIHTLAMRFSIDAVFFSRDGRVTKVARALPAWRSVVFGGWGSWGVVELPLGAAGPIGRGHQLRFEPPLA